MTEIDRDPFLEGLARQERHLKKLREDCSDGRSSTDNGLLADNQVLSEIGRFSDTYTPDKYDALTKRTRRDIIAARLNTAKTLDIIEEVSDKVNKDNNQLLRECRKLLLAVITLLLIIVWKIY